MAERAQQNLAGWPLMVGYSKRIAAEHRPNFRRSMAHPELEETLPECHRQAGGTGSIPVRSKKV